MPSLPNGQERRRANRRTDAVLLVFLDHDGSSGDGARIGSV